MFSLSFENWNAGCVVIAPLVYFLFWEGNLLSQSAKTISLPGLYCVVKLYLCKQNNMHCRSGGAGCIGLC